MMIVRNMVLVQWCKPVGPGRHKADMPMKGNLLHQYHISTLLAWAPLGFPTVQQHQAPHPFAIGGYGEGVLLQQGCF